MMNRTQQGNISKKINKLNALPPLTLQKKKSFDPIQSNDNNQVQQIQTQLEFIYQISKGNIQNFFGNIQEMLSRLYMDVAQQTLYFMNKHSFLDMSGAKLHISHNILIANLNILKFIWKKNNHQFDQKIFKRFNELQTNMIGYLKAKYPRSAQNFVPGDLMKVFKPFDYVESPQNDIIRAAGYYFGSQNNKDLLKSIKLFLNDIIEEVDIRFPKFQKMLTERAFNINSKNQKNSNYKIGRKLPQNTAKFINLTSNSLDIKSPQMFRVIIKWVGDMEDFLLNPESQVNQKETFKVINLDQEKFYVDQINSDDNRFILQELIRKLQQQKIQYKKDLQNLLIDMYAFQHNLIKIISQGQRKEKYVPRQDAQLIKFSSYNTNFLSWMLAQKLTIVMKKLIQVGKKFKNTNFMAPLDLIKFNVTDLLRAQISGSKTQLFEVYRNLSKLQQQGQIKIIKLKNRLATPLNDVMIIFRMKDSFIICELQLILADAYQNQSEKLKNIENLNHFFYQLQRSPYGVVSQLSVLVGYKDSRIGYDKNINYNNNKSGINFCQENHPEKIEMIRNQYKPFACTTCSKFYGRLQNMFAMKRCQLCNTYLCNVCIFQRETNLPQIFRKQQVINHFTRQIQIAIQINRGKKQINLSSVNGKNIYEKVVGKIILLKDVIATKKIKKMNITQFDSYIKSGECGENFIYCQFEKSQLSMISLKWNATRNEIQYNFQTFQEFYSNRNITFSQNDFIIILNAQATVQEVTQSDLQKNSSFNIIDKIVLAQKGKFKCVKLGQVYLIIGFTSVQQKKQIVVDGVSIQDYKLYYKKDFKYISLSDYFSYLPDLQSYRTNLFLQDFGLMNKQIQQFSDFEWRNNIKQLNISKNKITDISIVFKNLKNLKKLYASFNFISTLNIQQLLPNLTTLILNQNNIKKVQGLSNIPNITRLNLMKNQLKEFPTLKLEKLRQLNLSHNNQLSSKDFIENSYFPELLFADFSSSFNNEQSMNGNQKQEKVYKFNYPKLKLISIHYKPMPRIEINSTHIQRIVFDKCQLIQLKVNFKTIKFLDLTRNNIASLNFIFQNQNNIIEEAIFEQNQLTSLPKIMSRSLKKLSVYYNQINSLDYFKSSVCSALTFFNISFNKLTKWEPFSFPNLKQIMLQYNDFNDISTLYQSKLPKLQELEIPSSSGIKNIPKLKFENLKKLKIENLSNCDMIQFSHSQLPSLTELIFQNCSIQTFPLLKFQQLTNLQISQAKIKDSRNITLCQFPKLKNISFNQIHDFNLQQNANQVNNLQKKKNQKTNFVLDSFNFTNLVTFSICQCKFSNMQKVLLSQFKNLDLIYISGAIIKSLPKMNVPTLKDITIYSSQVQNISSFSSSYLPLLETLNLSYNKIEKLPDFQFKNLKDLNLQQNQLVKVGKLNLKNLTSLNLSNNKLKKLPIIQAQNLIDFYFDGNSIEDVSPIAKFKTPKLKNLTFSQLSFPLLIFPIVVMTKLQYLSIMNVNFKDLSALQKSKFQNLQTLAIIDCKILQKIPILKFPNLKYLNFQQLKITQLKNLQKSQLPELMYLVVTYTCITSINQLNFAKLTDIQFSQNELLQDVSLFALSQLPVLKNLQFSSCFKLNITDAFNFETLQNFTFYQCKKLQNLDFLNKCARIKLLRLSYGVLKSFNLNKKDMLQSMEVVDCMINDAQNGLKQLKNLNYLKLDRNKLKTIKKIQNNNKLEQISVSQNQLNDVDQFFKSKLQNISIDFSINQISNIKQITIKNIRSLRLNRNKIANIQFLKYLQKQNQNIQNIDLSDNLIAAFPKLSLNVRNLNLQSNQIQDLSQLQVSTFPKMNILYLNSNKIKIIPNISNLKELTYIFFQNNQIQDFHNILKLKSTANKLQSLSYSTRLTSQKLQEIKQSIFSKFQKINFQVHDFVEAQQNI